jgi:hypothetical protein
VLAVIVTIMTMTGALYIVLTVILKITTITGRSICSAINYCDNNRGVYLQ